MKIENPILYQIWKDRYCKNNESIEDNIHRVAKYCATSENEEQEFFDMMNDGLFFPAGRTMSNAGIGRDLTLNNCFNLNNVPDSIGEIFDYVKYGALTQKAGGGTGYNFSLIRPNGTPTNNDAIASGVVSFMGTFDSETHTILQGGRRGANMGVLLIYHPDIFEYLESKSYDEGKLVHFNLSIMVDDDFMKAKDNNEYIWLHYPCMTPEGKLIKDENQWKIKKQVKAKELWDLIMKKAYDTGEYGVFFYENLNKDNNMWYMENITGTNPCGEYVSGVLFGENPITHVIINPLDYMGACNLGSLFLHYFVENPFTNLVKVNYDKLKSVIHASVRFLDNIIDINKFPLKQYENYQKNVRTIGLGFTGLADLLVMLNLIYGSKKAIKFTEELTNFITKEAYKASIQIAKEKGQFPFLDREKFVQSNFIQKHIQKDKEWAEIANDILKYGIRNARIISIAPTGTLSLTFGNNCSSGLEPIFSLSYDRKVKIGGQDDSDIQIVKMQDYAYCEWLKVKDNENCIVTEDIFVTAMNLSVDAHLDMLKVIAFNTDMSCSKTINIPTEYSFEDTKKVYDKCYTYGIKGCTIFRPNEIRQGILITDSNKEKTIDFEEVNLPRGFIEEVPEGLNYRKYKMKTGCGNLYLFLGVDETEGKIYDCFTNTDGVGGCTINTQANSRLLSAAMRGGVPVEYLIEQLEKAGTCPSFQYKKGKGEKLCKGKSCSSAIANVLKDVIKEFKEDIVTDKSKSISENTNEFSNTSRKCPECGEPLRAEGGCFICVCGWSKCS